MMHTMNIVDGHRIDITALRDFQSNVSAAIMGLETKLALTEFNMQKLNNALSWIEQHHAEVIAEYVVHAKVLNRLDTAGT